VPTTPEGVEYELLAEAPTVPYDLRFIERHGTVRRTRGDCDLTPPDAKQGTGFILAGYAAGSDKPVASDDTRPD